MVDLDTKTLAMLGVSGIGLIISIATGSNNLESLTKGRSLYQSLSNERKLTAFEEEARLENEKIANQRYKSCILYVSGNHQKGFKFPALNEELVIKDRETNLPLADGYTVCDAHGGTALIKGGKPTSIKFTGNREVIKQRIAVYRGGQYAQPVAEKYSQPYVSEEKQ